LHEQIFLKAILAEFGRAGVEEATVQQVCSCFRGLGLFFFS